MKKQIIAGHEFHLSSDTEYGSMTLLVWAGEVVSDARRKAERIADLAEKAGYEVVDATTEQRGREGDEYPVVFLVPKKGSK